MIDRQYGKVTFQCDGCDEILETGEADFDAAKSAFDARGWVAESSAGQWLHFCGDCQ